MNAINRTLYIPLYGGRFAKTLYRVYEYSA